MVVIEAGANRGRATRHTTGERSRGNDVSRAFNDESFISTLAGGVGVDRRLAAILRNKK